MKKISLVFAALFSVVFGYAQEGAEFGIKGGVNISNLKWAGQPDLDSRIGFHAGLLAHIHLSPEWALQPEVQYSTEGAKMNIGSTETTIATDYINIPVMVQYMFSNGFRLEAGPQLGLMVNNDNRDNTFKSTNVGLGLGLNYLSHSGLGVGGRYVLGLSDINEPVTGEIKSRNLQVSLFYMFDNRHKAKSR